MNNQNPEISIILPCQNEEQALDFCLQQIKQTINKYNLSAEIIVSDSSTDNSPEIARSHGVILVKHNKDGYGAAYLEAFKHARGKYFFMADADGTYDFSQIPEFINPLKNGYDFVIGNRFLGNMEPGAMPASHRYFGNPLLSWILRLFFNAKIKDSHCGIRAISRKALAKLNLQTTGMEFASEMVIKALRHNLKIKEIPANYKKRMGKSKLKPVFDAWKHLRFMLLYSPLFLFFIPGLALFLLGIILSLWFLIIIGFQLIVFAAFAKTYAITHLNEKSPFMDKLYKHLTIEKGCVFGGIVTVAGIAIYFFHPTAAFTLIIIGIQAIFSSFMLSILSIKK